MEKLIEKIIENRTHCYFISPHLDDTAFSAGELISHLAGKVPVTVINIFTSAGDGKNTVSARQFLRQCGYKNAQKLFDERVLEDHNALSSLGVRVINLGFTDALWRKIGKTSTLREIAGKFMPETISTYPTFRFHAIKGKIQKRDKLLMEDIQEKIFKITKNDYNIKVFAPAGLGSHVDHVIAREVSKNVFGLDVIYWGDFPYSLNTGFKNRFINENTLEQESFKETTEGKIDLCNKYGSQIDKVIPDKKSLFEKEVYFVHRIPKEKKYDLKVENTLTLELQEEWENLWFKSELKNYYNSPQWFTACIETYGHKDYSIITCYENNKLVGILPVVKSKKYGVTVKREADISFSDRSSLLLLRPDSQISARILSKLSYAGDFLISEVDQKTAHNLISLLPEVKMRPASVGYHMLLDESWEKHMGQKQRKQIIKKIQKEEGNLTYEMYRGSAHEFLPLMKRIEERSLKMGDYKDIFSDGFLEKLYLAMEERGDEDFMVHLLFYKGMPICFRYGFIWGKTYIDANTAFLSTFLHLSPGRILAYKMAQRFQKVGIEEIDFARGESRFKKEFTPYKYRQYSLYYSTNDLKLAWLDFGFVFSDLLNKYRFVFEFARKTKNFTLKGFEGIISTVRVMGRKQQELVKNYSYQNS